MRFPYAYFIVDVVINAVVGYTLVKEAKSCGCSGACEQLQIWGLVVGIMLVIFAVLHFLVIINLMTDGRLSRLPYLGDLLVKIWADWTDIYLLMMIIIWSWMLVLIILDTKTLKCEKKFLTTVEVYLLYSFLMAFVYNNNREKITKCNNH